MKELFVEYTHAVFVKLGVGGRLSPSAASSNYR